MKVLFDTDVVLDVMIDRKPFVNTAEQLFSKVETVDKNRPKNLLP